MKMFQRMIFWEKLNKIFDSILKISKNSAKERFVLILMQVCFIWNSDAFPRASRQISNSSSKIFAAAVW